MEAPRLQGAAMCLLMKARADWKPRSSQRTSESAFPEWSVHSAKVMRGLRRKHWKGQASCCLALSVQWGARKKGTATGEKAGTPAVGSASLWRQGLEAFLCPQRDQSCCLRPPEICAGPSSSEGPGCGVSMEQKPVLS